MTVERVRVASGDELKALLHETREDLLLALLENPNFDETHVTVLLERLDLPANVLGAVAAEGKWASKEAVRLRLARHPRTPKRIALAVVGQLYLMDLVRLSLSPAAPADIRRLAEDRILHRVPHLPIGEKLSLARRAPARVAGAILAEGHPQAIKLTLGNNLLSESQILKILATPSVPERVVAAIAQHPKWSCIYNVRVALVRNPFTPVPSVLGYLPDLTLRDLKDVADIEDLTPHVRKYLKQELERRSKNAEGA